MLTGHPYSDGALGGALIGIAAALLLLASGRICGISGICAGALSPRAGDTSWRVYFIAGLLVGGLILLALYPATMPTDIDTSAGVAVAAGLLVGIGTRLGNGCTSGHGVCGLSRLSPRSMAATVTFIATGAATVAVARLVGG